MSENVWLSGTLLIILGGLIGVMGDKWFEPLTGAFAALCTFCAFMIFASILLWLNTTVGTIICFIVAVGFASLACWVMIKYHRVSTMFLAIGGGFLLGGITEGLIIALFHWESFAFYLIVTILFMCAGAYLGWTKNDSIQQYLTSVVGSYIFMRGWSFFGKGFPSEMEMYEQMTIPDNERDEL